MQGSRFVRLTRIIRAAVPAAGLTALVLLRPAPAHLSGGAPVAVRTLVLSDQARRYLALQYRSYPTEFMGCMVGEIRGATVIVERIAPADVDPQQSTRTHVLPRQTCEDAGWTGTVGMIHSHPNGERCFYYFPGTQVATSDGQSFARQPYAVDAIMCGDSIVWISRDLVQRELQLVARPTALAAELQPGNRVHEGSAP